jgi:DNA-binding CsgD family transcriptional regulator
MNDATDPACQIEDHPACLFCRQRSAATKPGHACQSCTVGERFARNWGEVPPVVESTPVDITVTDDGQAQHVTAVLEALGYKVTRTPGPASTDMDRVAAIVDMWTRVYKLHDREAQCAALFLLGWPNDKIGKAMKLNRSTVKFAMHSIFTKTNTESREGLLVLALTGRGR